MISSPPKKFKDPENLTDGEVNYADCDTLVMVTKTSTGSSPTATIHIGKSSPPGTQVGVCQFHDVIDCSCYAVVPKKYYYEVNNASSAKRVRIK